ncbi:MAG TPA: hypothetical protein VNB91_05075 [Jatrophihabitantaceae bacterium]|nr:hypothetical protein [Jatrophihabitantaceae bacterium]
MGGQLAPTEPNEHVATGLTERVIRSVRYFSLRVSDDQEPSQWDFGVWQY